MVHPLVPLVPYQTDIDLKTHEKPTRLSVVNGSYKLKSAVRYLEIEVDDALKIAEQTEI